MPETKGDLLKQINREIEEFETQNITIVNGYRFNQKATIETAYRLYNSQYKRGDVDVDGEKKFFYNIVKSPCRATTKAIDFDTKHIKIQTASGGSPLKTWYFERDLKFWMKDKRFGKVLNRIFDELPKFGSVVIKVIKGVPHFVDLRNFVVRQDADSLDGAEYIIEKHLYSAVEFKKVAKTMGWENSDKVLEDHYKSQKPYILVYERYGEIDQQYTRLFYADAGVDTEDRVSQEHIPDAGTELKRTVVDKHPYWEFHLEKIAGRWLGVGVIEILADTQFKMNQDANLEAKVANWMSMVLFQTIDSNFNSNLMTEVQNGQVLNPDSPITQIPIDARNLAFFQQSHDKWITNRDEMTFVREVIRGERLPAGTPLGSARLAAAMAGGYFDQIMENVAEDIKEFLYKVIIPRFQTENTQEHTLRLVGEDLDTYNDMLIAQKATDELFSFMNRKGKLPTTTQYELMKAAIAEQIKQGTEKLVNLPKNFYKDLKYKIDIIITGEQKDSTAQTGFMFSVLQAITADPTMLQDPSKRKILMRLMEQNGIQGFDFFPSETPSLQNMMAGQQTKMGGGGVSRPAAPNMQNTVSAETQI